MLLRLTFIFSVLFSSPAWADFLNGNTLYDLCTSEVYYEKGICGGYVMAISDILTSSPLYGQEACIPTEATAGQVRDVVEQWLSQNPQERHYSSTSLAVLALTEAFPCN